MKRRLLLGMVGLYLMHVPFLSLLMSMEGGGTEGLLTDRGEQKPQQGRDDVFSEKAVFLELASLCAFKPEAASGLCYKSVFVVSGPGGWRTAPKPSYRETYSIVNRRPQEAERTISEQCGFLFFSLGHSVHHFSGSHPEGPNHHFPFSCISGCQVVMQDMVTRSFQYCTESRSYGFSLCPYHVFKPH